MQTLSYSEFSKRLTKQAAGRRVPLSGTIELTNRCPLNCSHCYNNLPMNDVAARKRELSTAEYIAVLDQLAEAGCLWVCFSGGEIFARRDFFDIYDHAKSRGFVVTLFTNGILIDERVADRLAKSPPFVIEITLYGRTQETYEELTQIPGSWEKCMRGIRLLLGRNLPLKLKTVAVSVNRHEVYEMKDFARDLGVDFKFDAMMNPRIDCSASPLDVRLTPVEAVELDLRDPDRVTAYQGLAIYNRPKRNPGEAAPMYDCGGGNESWAIDPYGNLSICVLSHVDEFNLREYSFAEAWDLLSAPRAKRATRETKCNNCAMVPTCGMCPAFAELENGDPEAPVDYLCHVTHLRAEVLGFEVPPHGDCEYCPGGAERETILREAAEVNVNSLLPASHPSVVSASSECGDGGHCSCSTR